LLREVDQTLINRGVEIERVLLASGIHNAGDFERFNIVNPPLMLTAAPEVSVDIVDTNGKRLWASQNHPSESEVVDRLGVSGQTLETLTLPDGLRLRRYVKPQVLEDDFQIFIILTESLAHVEAALEGSIGRTVLLGIVVLTLTEILGHLAFRGIFYPLRKLVDTAEAIVSTDDVTKRVPVYLDTDEEIKRTALAFNALMDRVEQLLEVSKQLLADTSHELRNPLTVLMTDLDLLREDLVSEQREEVISEAQDTVRRLTRLVSDMLLLSRTEAHSEVVSPEEIDVVELVEKVAKRYSRSLGEEERVAFDRSKSADVAMAFLDREKTEQILINLFENGVRYSQGRVVVRVMSEAPEVIISIQDDGCGIDASEQEKIFRRFYRIDQSRDRHSGGTGLGLPVARALARLQGGDITLKSEVNKGSDFWVRFPSAAQD